MRGKYKHSLMPLYNNVHVQYIKMGLSISYTTYICLILRYLEYERVIGNLLSIALSIIRIFFFKNSIQQNYFSLQKLHVVNDIATYIIINILHCFVYSKEMLQFFLNCYKCKNFKTFLKKIKCNI